MLPTRHEFIADLIAIERRQHGGGYERIPWRLAREIVWADEMALLTLMLGVANWGIDWDGYRTHRAQLTDAPPDDPAGSNWHGVSHKQGKRWLDGTGLPLGGYGGLGIVHADSGFLTRVYSHWGPPPLPSRVLEYHYNKMLRSEHWQTWKQWARELLQDGRFHIWLAGEWIQRYWRPQFAAYMDDDRSWIDSVECAALLSRVANSGSGVARRLRTRHPLPTRGEIVEGYRTYKAKRSDRAADRALRQTRYAMRVGVVARALQLDVVDDVGEDDGQTTIMDR